MPGRPRPFCYPVVDIGRERMDRVGVEIPEDFTQAGELAEEPGV